MKRRTSAFGFQDAAASALCLSALGAAQLWSAPLMSTVPRHLQDAVWMTFGCTVGAALFLLVRLTNEFRSLSINRALSKCVLGSESTSSFLSLTIATLAGGLASFQSLPGQAS